MLCVHLHSSLAIGQRPAFLDTQTPPQSAWTALFHGIWFPTEELIQEGEKCKQVSGSLCQSYCSKPSWKIWGPQQVDCKQRSFSLFPESPRLNAQRMIHNSLRTSSAASTAEASAAGGRKQSRVLVLRPDVRPVPLRWQSQVQDIGPPETSWLHVISNGKSSARDLHLNAKTQLHSMTSKLQC